MTETIFVSFNSRRLVRMSKKPSLTIGGQKTELIELERRVIKVE